MGKPSDFTVERTVAFPGRLIGKAPILQPATFKAMPANDGLSALLPKHAEGLFRATTREELILEIRRIIGEVDFDTFFLGAYSGEVDGAGSASFFSFANPRWVEKYEREGLIDIDPRINHCMDRSYPLLWDWHDFQDLRKYSADTAHFAEEAASFGIKAGIAVPIISHVGLQGVFAVSSSVNATMASLAPPTIRGRIAILREYLTELVETRGGANAFSGDHADGLRGRLLSPREKQVIELAALGLTADDIAKRLKIAASTVRAFQLNAKTKLGAGSLAHAVAIALARKIIEMPY